MPRKSRGRERKKSVLLLACPSRGHIKRLFATTDCALDQVLLPSTALVQLSHAHSTRDCSPHEKLCISHTMHGDSVAESASRQVVADGPVAMLGDSNVLALATWQENFCWDYVAAAFGEQQELLLQ